MPASPLLGLGWPSRPALLAGLAWGSLSPGHKHPCGSHGASGSRLSEPLSCPVRSLITQGHFSGQARCWAGRAASCPLRCARLVSAAPRLDQPDQPVLQRSSRGNSTDVQETDPPIFMPLESLTRKVARRGQRRVCDNIMLWMANCPMVQVAVRLPSWRGGWTQTCTVVSTAKRLAANDRDAGRKPRLTPTVPLVVGDHSPFRQLSSVVRGRRCASPLREQPAHHS